MDTLYLFSTFVPGAQPVAAATIGIGKGMSIAGGGINATLDVSRGNYGKAALSLSTSLVGGGVGSKISKTTRLADGEKLILQTGVDLKLNPRDAQGNVMAVYNISFTSQGGNIYECTTKLEERHIYGSSRLGLNKKPNENKHKFSASIGQNGMFDFITNQPAEYPNGPGQAKMIGGSGTIALYHDTAQSYTLELYTEHPIKISSTAMAGFSITEGNGTWITTDTFLTDAAQKITIEALDTLYLFSTFEEMFGYMEYSSAKTTKLKGGSISMGGPLLPIFVKNYSKTAGEKAYELVSHLGNVHMVISDRKVSVEDGSSGNVAYFVSDVISTNDVYPFGSLLPQRNFSSEKYRYGFNGMEKDDEVKGIGNNLDFGARIYDSRVARWLSVDPIVKEWESPYASFRSSPIFLNDRDGKDARVSIVRNNHGGGVITLSTVAHIYGKNSEQVAAAANKKMASLNTSSTYIDQSGNEWTVNFEVKFEVNQELTKLDQNNEGLTYQDAKNVKGVNPGDNIVCSGCLPSGGDIETAYGSKVHVLGGKGSAETAIHGVFHNIGFDHTNVEGDVLNSRAVVVYPINFIDQKHFEDVAKGVLKESTGEEVNGIKYPGTIKTDKAGNVNNEVISGENFSNDK